MSEPAHILIYCQHLSGTGHYVRSYEIGSVLARRFAVTLTDGGVVVPRRPLEHSPAGCGLRLLELPRLARHDGQVIVIGGGDVAGAMAERSRRLGAAIERHPVDAVMIEHFPFSKWELADEIGGLIAMARQANPVVKIICSRRDIIPASRYDGETAAHADRVVAMLDRAFDAVLVHADPAVVTIGDHTPWAGRIGVPIFHTGYVSEPIPASEMRSSIDPVTIIVSEGGAGDGRLTRACIEAWEMLNREDVFADATFIIFGSPSGPGIVNERVTCCPFGIEFLPALARASVSVSHAGYNTCMNLLSVRIPSILVPHPGMTDQSARAACLAALGLARICTEEPGDIARSIRAALHHGRVHHAVDLGGAMRTCNIMEDLLSDAAH